MTRLFESDIDLRCLLDKTVAVIGYGNQGRAHALNLRDTGISVKVGSREGGGWDRAMSDGWVVEPITNAVSGADVIALLVPDEAMSRVFTESVLPSVSPDATLLFAHGFAVTYGQVSWRGSAGLVSPAGPGTSVREEFLLGRGVPAFFASTDARARSIALAYGLAIGCARMGLIETTFREETECDLFGEQAVLCGGMPELAEAAFQTLVEAGYSAEVAYTECVAQIRLLADLIARYGIAGMKERISDTAEWGSYLVGPRVVSPEVKVSLCQVLEDIRSGRFANGWLAEAASGKTELLRRRRLQADHFIEKTGNQLRDIDS